MEINKNTYMAENLGPGSVIEVKLADMDLSKCKKLSGRLGPLSQQFSPAPAAFSR